MCSERGIGVVAWIMPLVLPRLLAIVFLMLIGCAVNSPVSIKVEKISLVKMLPETKKEVDYGRYVDASGSIYRLRLEMLANTDLVKLAEESHVISNHYFCNKPNYAVLMGTNRLYWNGEEVQELAMSRKYGSAVKSKEKILKESYYQTIRSVTNEENRQDVEKLVASEGTNKHYVYSMYLGLYSPEIKSWKKNSDESQKNEFEAYDLVAQPEDVCSVVEGRWMFGDVFESNVVKIDKAMINNLLKDLK